MREIKFRAWDPYNKIMYYVSKDEVSSKPSYEVGIWGDGWEMYEITAAGKRVVAANVTKTGEVGGNLMLYTGLKDKNDVEVCHKDIVKVHTGLLGTVEWDDKRAGFYLRVPGHKPSEHLGGMQYGEVIGNVYENLELLV